MDDLTGKIVTGFISVVVTIIAALTLRRLEPKAKVVWWNTRATIFEVPVPTSNAPLIENPANQSSGDAIATLPANTTTPVTPQPPASFQLATTSTFIVNRGNRKANNVQICHVRRPENFKLYPSLQYKEEYTPDSAHIITIESLGPHQHVAVEYLAFAVMPVLNYIRADDAFCNSIETIPQPILPAWQIRSLQVLILIGAIVLLVATATLLSIMLSHFSSFFPNSGHLAK